METVVYDETPLAEYLKGAAACGRPSPALPTIPDFPADRGAMADEADAEQIEWSAAAGDQNVDTPPPSPPSPPGSSFAPIGRPVLKRRFRSNIPNPLRVDVQQAVSLSSSIDNRYSVSRRTPLSLLSTLVDDGL